MALYVNDVFRRPVDWQMVLRYALAGCICILWPKGGRFSVGSVFCFVWNCILRIIQCIIQTVYFILGHVVFLLTPGRCACSMVYGLQKINPLIPFHIDCLERISTLFEFFFWFCFGTSFVCFFSGKVYDVFFGCRGTLCFHPDELSFVRSWRCLPR